MTRVNCFTGEVIEVFQEESMRNQIPTRNYAVDSPLAGLLDRWGKLYVGHEEILQEVHKHLLVYSVGLAPQGMPIGVFLITGATGSGKTYLVESLAQALHGESRNVLTIHCGEFQLEHEVAKLIGAPPGYLGHRETQPMITQQKLNCMSSERCNVSIMLLDEVEKSALSLQRILLGVFGKAQLHLGDNTTVNFERTLIFMTSNQGAEEVSRLLRPSGGIGFNPLVEGHNLAAIETCMAASLRRKFAPEFLNRVSKILHVPQLTRNEQREIMRRNVKTACEAVANSPAAGNNVRVETSPRFMEALVDKSFSNEYGARNIARLVKEHLTIPCAEILVGLGSGQGGTLVLDYDESGFSAKLKKHLPTRTKVAPGGGYDTSEL
jgi:ATP-dependent Clp protease ATP-binding subunit ClpA